MFTKYVAIYIPSTLDGHKKAPVQTRRALIRQVQSDLTAEFGGSTTVNGTGTWKSDQFGLISERVAIVKSYYSDDYSPVLALTYAAAIAQYVKTALHQEAVTVETEKGIEFIS